MKKAISCIVPVYNKAKYLEDFLDSILGQTFELFELILVNDNSTDESLKILENSSRKDKRIKVYTLESNVGAAEARNYGFNQSKGEYVIFLDADDICEKEMLEKTYLNCLKNDADICIFDIDSFCDVNPNNRKKLNFNYYAKKYVDTYPILNKPYAFRGLYTINTSCAFNKLIKRDIIEKNKIVFQDIPNANDCAFSFLVCFFCDRIFFDEKVFIHYRINHYESITTQTKENYCACAIQEIYLRLSQKYYKESLDFLKQMFAIVYPYYNKLPVITTRIAEAIKVFDNKDILAKENAYNLQNEYYNEMIFKIINHDFDEPYINILWRYSRSKLLPYLQTFINQDKKIAIWGVGAIGKDLLKIMKNENIPIDCFIDNNVSMQNTVIEDVPIMDFDDVESNVDLIIISSIRAIDDIDKQINYSKETIDIMAYMRFDIVERDIF